MAAPDPIPVYAGDDWSFAFTYREGGGNGAPVDLTGSAIVGALYTPFSPVPVPLTIGAGQTGVIDPALGKFGLGIGRDLTAAIPSGPKGGALHVFLVSGGLLRTAGVWPLLVLAPRDLMPAVMVNRVVTDPVTGRTLTFDGPTDAFPVVSGDLTTNFDAEGNPAVLLLG